MIPAGPEMAVNKASVSVLDIDPTMLIQMVLFFIAFLVLKKILFKPVLAVLEERRQRTSKMREEAEDLRAEASDTLADYERRLEEVRAEANAEKQKMKAAAWDAEQKMLANVSSQAADMVEKSRQEIEKDTEKLKSELTKEIDTYAYSIASRILERDVGKEGPKQ